MHAVEPRASECIDVRATRAEYRFARYLRSRTDALTWRFAAPSGGCGIVGDFLKSVDSQENLPG